MPIFLIRHFRISIFKCFNSLVYFSLCSYVSCTLCDCLLSFSPFIQRFANQTRFLLFSDPHIPCDNCTLLHKYNVLIMVVCLNVWSMVDYSTCPMKEDTSSIQRKKEFWKMWGGWGDGMLLFCSFSCWWDCPSVTPHLLILNPILTFSPVPLFYLIKHFCSLDGWMR